MDIALNILRALADPTRLRMLLLVRHMELSVGELAQVLGQSQPRVSRHVRILAGAGLVRRVKEGAWVFVRLGHDARTLPMLAALDAYGADAAADLAQLGAVRAERTVAAAAYFATHASRWDEIRLLHVADGEVEAAILRLLRPRSVGDLLDIGTGTGRMIELLGAAASSAVGVDRSPEMLRLARGKLEAAGLGRAEMARADMYALPQPDTSIDTIILHQVLHFADAPAAAIAEAARVLRPGGQMLIVDFAPHEREELRTDHAHARLGFADDQVRGWLHAAGLQVAVIEHLQPRAAAAPLTVTLWLGERRPLEQRQAA